jgi:hypothetical protein
MLACGKTRCQHERNLKASMEGGSKLRLRGAQSWHGGCLHACFEGRSMLALRIAPCWHREFLHVSMDFSCSRLQNLPIFALTRNALLRIVEIQRIVSLQQQFKLSWRTSSWLFTIALSGIH